MASTTSPPLAVFLGRTSKLRECSDEVVVSRSIPDIGQQCTMSFQRTVRVSDNGFTNSLPPSLGTLPLYQTSSYGTSMPDHLQRKGGFFLPMYRKEISRRV